MRIPTDEQERLRSERGVAATEACDACGMILGAVRYTRRTAEEVRDRQGKTSGPKKSRY